MSSRIKNWRARDCPSSLTKSLSLAGIVLVQRMVSIATNENLFWREDRSGSQGHDYQDLQNAMA